MPDDISINKKPVVFLHIARCGGSTLNNLMDLHISNAQILRANLLHREGDCVEGIAGHSGAPVSYKKDLGRYKFVSGHNNLDDLLAIFPTAAYITTLRDPVKRVVSLYNYWRSHKPAFIKQNGLRGPALARSMTLEAFIELDEPVVRYAVQNGMTRQLFRGLTSEFEGSEEDLAAQGVARIDRFAFVGLTDMFDLSVWLLCETLGWAYPVEFEDANRYEQNLGNKVLFESVDRTPPSPALQARIRELNSIDAVLYQYAARRFESDICAALGKRSDDEPRRTYKRKGDPPLLLKRIASRAIRILSDYVHPIEP